MLDKKLGVPDSGLMDTFLRHASMDTTVFEDPGFNKRLGPPLTRGSLFTLLGTVAGEALTDEAHKAIRRLEAESWYHGQLLETLLNMIEDYDAELPEFVGRNIYFMFRTQLQQVGINSATDLIKSMPGTCMRPSSPSTTGIAPITK